jgi:hypothetical protein
VLARLQKLMEKHPRFRAAERLEEYATAGRKFYE